MTALVPAIGYDKSAEIAKQAHKSGQTVRELVLEQKLLDASAAEKALDARSMTEPSV